MNGVTVQQKGDKLARVCMVKFEDKFYSTPTYFPSVSSIKTRFDLMDLFYLIKKFNYPRLLLSAYDIDKIVDKEKLTENLSEFRKQNVLFLDSGVFESDNRPDPKWVFKSYKNILSQFQTDIFTGFDILPHTKDFSDDEEYRNTVFQSAAESSAFRSHNIFLPIIHGKSADHLLALVRDFIDNNSTQCCGLAVSERDCGKSVFERAETLTELRHVLDKRDDNLLLHILGCGNPLSMWIYSYCGADSFDSLDWLEHILDPGDNTIRDFSHLDLINCKCRICSSPKLTKSSYLDKALLHNLRYYQDFVVQTQNLIRYNNLQSFLKTVIGEEMTKKLNNL